MAKKEEKAKVLIAMGSDSDWDVMSAARDTLGSFDVPCDVVVTSAHRCLERTVEIVRKADEDGVCVFIVGAGAAAHLGGVIAAATSKPVVAVPLDATSMKGMDALLATVMMPGGIPVATMAIGKAGAKNAAIFAAEILALTDKKLAAKLAEHKAKMAEEVERKSEGLRKKIAEGK